MQLTEDDFSRLAEMDKEANAKVRESDFIKRLLPHLVPAQDNSRRNVDIYIAAAGHANRMIDVVADGNPDKVLFTVPPLVSQTPMTIRDKDPRPETDIGEISAMFEAEVSLAPPGLVIDSFVDRLMSLSFTSLDAIEMTYALMWAHIYRRYNLPLELLFGERSEEIRRLVGLGQETSQDAPQATTATLEGFDDDDLDPL